MTKRYIKNKKCLLVVLVSVLFIFLITGCSNTTPTNNKSVNELKQNQQEETEPPKVTVRGGSSSGVKTAIENNEGMQLDKNLQYNDADIKIENAVWEDNELAITYTINESGFKLGWAELVNANDNLIHNGRSSHFSEDSGIIIFRGINEEALQSDTVWLRIYSLENIKAFQKDGAIYSFPYLKLKATREMQEGEFVTINKELEVEQGTYLFKYMSFGENITNVTFQFTPREKYQNIYNSQAKTQLIPDIRLNAEGKYYASRGKSVSNNTLSGSISFDALPIEKLNSFRISVLDNFALVDWKVPIAVQNNEAEVLELTEDIMLPEGKLILTGIRQGTKSTRIDFNFEPAVDFEGIDSIYLDAFLRNNEKYYNKYSLDYQDSVPGLTGTIKFDPVRYDNIKELVFILGSIQYTYNTESSVNVSRDTIPQTINALGKSFIIDKMEYKNGETLLHIDYGRKDRKFYSAEFEITAKKTTSLSYRGEYKQGYLEFRDKDQLSQGLEKLRNNLGDYGLDLLKKVDLNKGYIGSSFQINGVHGELKINIKALNTMSYSGEIVKIKLE